MIPKIIHRTIQKDTNEVIDTCWEKMQEMHPDWEFKTWYDEDEYPYVGGYLNECIAGAFRADLIRLDVVYRFGGVYLDSDVYVVKPLDPLLATPMFCSGEYETGFGNIAFGAEPNHPIIKELIDMAIEKLPVMRMGNFIPGKTKQPYAWGPYVHTEVLFGKSGVNRLPLVAFQPYTLVQHSDEVPLYRPRKDKASHKATPLTEATYGVHLNNWSWSEEHSWDKR
jgi:hypothetical protein